MQERFTIINFADHILPLYEMYCKYSKLTLNRYSALGGSRNLCLTVFKKDATYIADKVFDLLFILSKTDQELFDANSHIINYDGFNSEGFHVAKYLKELKKMSNKKLFHHLELMKMGNPNKLQTIKMISDEIVKRKIEAK